MTAIGKAHIHISIGDAPAYEIGSIDLPADGVAAALGRGLREAAEIVEAHLSQDAEQIHDLGGNLIRTQTVSERQAGEFLNTVVNNTGRDEYVTGRPTDSAP